MTLSTRLTPDHHALVVEAARKSGVTDSRGSPVPADYIRPIILGEAAAALGLPAPDLGIYEPRRRKLADAAAAAGIPDVEEFERAVADATIKFLQIGRKVTPEAVAEFVVRRAKGDRKR